MCGFRTTPALYVVFIIAVSAASQDNAPTIVTGGIRPLTELLKQHHVELTEAGLVNALRSHDEQVRYLAALRLAEENDVDAVPEITKALAAEKVPATRLNIAIALVQLGQEKGIAELITSCENSDLPGYLRARALRYLLDHGREICFDTVNDLLSSEESDSRIQALSLLPLYQHLTHDEPEMLVALAVRSLGDKVPSVRLEASIALSRLADASVIPDLQNAITSEKDSAVRSQMQISLQRLREKQSEKP